MTESAADVHGELVTTERVAIVVGRIMLGKRMTTREIAEYVALSPSGAWRMMDKIGRVLPIRQVDDVWERCEVGASY